MIDQRASTTVTIYQEHYEMLLRNQANFEELLRLANSPGTRTMPLMEAINSTSSIAAGHGLQQEPVEERVADEVIPEPVDEVAGRVQQVYVPDGYADPSDDLPTVQSQYVIAATHNERLGQILRELGKTALAVNVEVPIEVTGIVCLVPLLSEIDRAIRNSHDLSGAGTLQVELGREVALALRSYFDRNIPSVVAISEFLRWAVASLDPDSLVAQNLRTVHLYDHLFGYLR